jgi:hypothetical protein
VSDIDAIKDKHQERLMTLPNVCGVGIGEEDGQPVIKVFVTQKVPEAALKPEEVVPRDLEGYRTDVEELGEVMAQE